MRTRSGGQRAGDLLGEGLVIGTEEVKKRVRVRLNVELHLPFFHNLQRGTSALFPIVHSCPRTDIQSRARDIVELAPPREVPPLNPVLEDKSDRDPRRIVDTRRWRDVCDRVKRDRRADVRVPAVRVFALPVPEWYWEEHAKDDSVYLRIVY